jgi:hypothetical protein
VTHTDEVTAPFSINPPDFLTLYKETAKLTTIPAPTVLHSMMGVIDEVNGVIASATGQDNLASTNATACTAAATLAAQIATAEAAVTTANTQKELVDAIAHQTRGAAEEVAKQLACAKARLNNAQRDLSAAVDEIEIPAVNERIMVAKVTYGKVDHAGTT